MSVINLRKVRKWRADASGHRWVIYDWRQKDRSRMVRKLLLNGRDVTHRCFYFDTRRGRARLFDVDARGKKFARDGSIAWHEYRGRVQVCWKAAA